MTSRFIWVSQLGLVAGLALALSGCSTQKTQEDQAKYVSPYQQIKDVCVMPAETSHGSLDLTLLHMLRDRGFTPTLLATQDESALNQCRALVTFSARGDRDELETPNAMSLTFLDTFTGETYHVAASRQGVVGTRTLLAKRVFEDPEETIRKLVERLFPERTDSR